MARLMHVLDLAGAYVTRFSTFHAVWAALSAVLDAVMAWIVLMLSFLHHRHLRVSGSFV